MKFSALETLQSVVTTGSFVGAANEVGLTPSAVSLQMKQLEEYFGRPLFDRSGRTAIPTPLARELALAMNQALGIIEGFRTSKSYAVSGTIRLGAVPSVQTAVLPSTLRIAQERHPALNIRLTLDVSRALQAEVSAGSIDAAVIVRPATGGSSRLHWIDLTREQFVLLVPKAASHMTAQQYLVKYPWIRYDTSLTGGKIAADYVRRKCPGARCQFELASTETIIAMVSEGLGVSVVPRPRAQLLRAYEVHEIDLGRNAPARQISLVCRPSDATDRRVLAIEDILRLCYRTPASSPLIDG